ncbi:glycoside hydrolase family 19 protein [Chryseobacterium tongliaoense]|uniref:glycoside hydrolase family 19 protein n=1 Tax=Chryseobacterium tongliaoense TaxID=3240933 RepID=UPI00351250C6
MSKKGVSKISGNATPKVGEKTTYSITDWYSGTPREKRNPALVTWELFKKRSNGSFTTTSIKKTGDGSFTFGEVAQKHTYRLEAYLYESEGQGSSAIEINPQPVEVPKINKVELFYVDDTKGTVFSYTEKLVAKAQCVNLTGEKLVFTLWEDDAKGDGHNAGNLFVDKKEATVGKNGVAIAEFVLTKALMQKAMSGETDPKELEFYVTVEYFKNKKHATNNVDVKNPLAFELPKEKPLPKPQPQSKPAAPAATPKAQGSPAAQKPESQKDEKGIVDKALDWWNELWDYQESKGTVKPEQKPTQSQPSGKTTSVVEEVKAEALLDAYFAKEEFTDETSEVAGQHQYTFQNNNKNIDKDKIADIIKKKVNPQVKADKKYAKLDDIKNALTQTSYAKGESISFNLYKLGPKFVRINSAPLEEEIYVVATTMLLDGKEVSIHIKEKEAIFVGQDADLPVLEAKENGNEITILKATAQKGLAKVKIKLRPKSDETLTGWKDKLSGIKDGTHTYTFGGNNATGTAEQKKNIAGIIAGKIKAELTQQKKFAKTDVIEKALTKEAYNKGEQITFDVYKSVAEYLWLKAECTGELKKHEGEFLKKEGEYFVVGKKCFCNRDITLTEFEDILKKLRESESMANTSSLFYADNCNLDDKTNDSFIKKLNATFKKYDINTCIRKIHFLAQIYHETDRLQTTKEYNGKDSYKPYVGRGLMQLTWKAGYARYKAYSGTDVITDYEKVAEELELTVDTAGWFWKQGKELSPGSTWTVPTTSFSEYDKSTGKQYPKQEFTYDLDGVSNKYGTVDINLLADADYIDTVSWLVNGGGNGRTERRQYLKEIKKIFKYPEECANAGAASTGNSSVTIHFVGDTALESGISQRTRTVLEEVGTASKNTDIYITSTARTPADQARIMYDNIERTGAAEQKGIYANAGDQVIDVYTAGVNAQKTQEQIIQDMEAKINELGPSTVSKHLADPAVMNTFDVSIRRLTNPNDFKTEMQKRSELHQLLDENGAYHIEINQ